MSNSMAVVRDGKTIYDIVMEPDFQALKREVDKLGMGGRSFCIVTDSNVAPLYLDEVRTILEGCCQRVTTFIFPAGEESKTLETVQNLYEHLIVNHFERKDLLVALGGGVTGDLCGFAAATYLRGIDFIQIPTTLLSQVDSSIGGKTGVDFNSYKNMVGAFHMPRLVYTSLGTLKTLTDQQFSSGMGEVVKHGLIKNREYYNWLKANSDAINARDLAVCETMVLESNRIKRDVVEQDPTEQGERALLNFGHTLGHAVEKLKEFSMFHGHCVGLGCIAAGYISAGRGLITMEEADDIRGTMELFGLPVTVRGLRCGDVVETTKSDKKMEAGTVKFILLSELGRAFVDRTVSEREMEAGLGYIMDTKE